MDTRKPLIAGNWKMYKTPAEAREAAGAVAQIAGECSYSDVMLAPSFVSITEVAGALKGKNVLLCGQNMHWEAEGAYTGEVSGAMLRAAGCSHVIIGHSERRQLFHENDESVNRKARAALINGLVPVVCVGETKKEREEGETLKVLDRQIRRGLEGLFPQTAVVAYEPVWAIGTGLTATSAQAQEAHAFIRGLVGELAGKSVAYKLRILYGGSVKPGNIAELMSMPDIDGALVGGASLDPESFGKIIRFRG
jgi:triosephosphate isomerase